MRGRPRPQIGAVRGRERGRRCHDDRSGRERRSQYFQTHRHGRRLALGAGDVLRSRNPGPSTRDIQASLRSVGRRGIDPIVSYPAPPATPSVTHASPVPKYPAAQGGSFRATLQGRIRRHTPAAGGASAGSRSAARETRTPRASLSRAAFPLSGARGPLDGVNLCAQMGLSLQTFPSNPMRSWPTMVDVAQVAEARDVRRRGMTLRSLDMPSRFMRVLALATLAIAMGACAVAGPTRTTSPVSRRIRLRRRSMTERSSRSRVRCEPMSRTAPRTPFSLPANRSRISAESTSWLALMQ